MLLLRHPRPVHCRVCAQMFRSAPANGSSWTAGVKTGGVGRAGAQKDDPNSQLILAAEI